MSTRQVVDAVVVGNTAIHHFFVGLPVEQLGASPYTAAVSEPLDIEAEHLGLELAPGAKVYLAPNIAGYVGADHVSMLLATEAWQAREPTIALDIGTNTEISLAVDGQLLSCSCASGPAFEGAHIHAGMRAAPGRSSMSRSWGTISGSTQSATVPRWASAGPASWMWWRVTYGGHCGADRTSPAESSTGRALGRRRSLSPGRAGQDG